MTPEWKRMLATGQEKVIGHYRRLIESSNDEKEHAMLQRRMFRHERELTELLADEWPDQAKAA